MVAARAAGTIAAAELGTTVPVLTGSLQTDHCL